MHSLKSISITAISTILLFMAVTFVACKKKDVVYNDTTLIRPCDNVICLNGGACQDGVCFCASGYEGLKCASKWSDKFVGNYKASDECDTTAKGYLVNILAVVNVASQIRIDNLGLACPGTSIFATINPEKTTFNIPSQTTCGNIYFSGNGNISGNYINIFLKQRDSTNHTSNNCSIVLDRQ